jgi:hypothetical protein
VHKPHIHGTRFALTAAAYDFPSVLVAGCPLGCCCCCCCCCLLLTPRTCCDGEVFLHTAIMCPGLPHDPQSLFLWLHWALTCPVFPQHKHGSPPARYLAPRPVFLPPLWFHVCVSRCGARLALNPPNVLSRLEIWLSRSFASPRVVHGGIPVACCRSLGRQRADAPNGSQRADGRRQRGYRPSIGRCAGGPPGRAKTGRTAMPEPTCES